MQANWITPLAASELIGVSKRAVTKAIGVGRIKAQEVVKVSAAGNKTSIFLINLADLPEEARLKYAMMQDQTDNGDFDLGGYKNRFGDKGVSELMTRLDAVREMALYKQSGARDICKKRSELAEQLGISPARLSQLEKAYADKGLHGIGNETKRADKGSPRQLCQMSRDVVHSEACLSCRPKNRAIYARLMEIASSLGEDACAACPYNPASLYRAELRQAGLIGENDACEREEKDGMLDATIENRREAAAIKRRIAALYEQVAEDMASKAASSKAGGLTEAFAYNLSRSLRERCHELWRDVGDVTKTAMHARAERMTWVQSSFLADAARRAELDLKPTLKRVFASTSDDAVRHVLQGGIYGGKAPALSKRIWRSAELQSGQIEQVLAGAIAKKQSAVQLAKALEAYLNPGIIQPDNWNDVYPDMPFVYKVDYNAKRLAVTSINHAGWGATISAARKNPYADYLHWELTPAHVITDVCDGYAEHDEGLGIGNWPIDAAPLPHPWCTCLWYVDTDKTLEEIGQELRAWEDGESNPRLDRAFGEWERDVLDLSEQFDKIRWNEGRFESPELRSKHYKKHHDDFGVFTEEEYEIHARDLMLADSSDDVKRLVRSDESVSKYRISTNEFAVGNKDGSIRTYFKPIAKEAYWQDEIDRNK